MNKGAYIETKYHFIYFTVANFSGVNRRNDKAMTDNTENTNTHKTYFRRLDLKRQPVQCIDDCVNSV